MQWLGIDVGGTFTDLAALRRGDGRASSSTKVPSHPATTTRRACWPGSTRSASPARASRARARHHGRHQCLLERNGARTAVLSRRAAFATCSRSAAPSASSCSTSSDACAEAARRAQAPLRGRRAARLDGADPCRSTRAGRGRARAPGAAGARAPRRSRSACSTRTSTPPTSARSPTWSRARCPACSVSPRRRRGGGVPRVRALLHDGAERLPPAAHGPLSAPRCAERLGRARLRAGRSSVRPRAAA